ncbi:MAG: hypothetical protein LBH80_05055 [Prevotellaceae bacterium]|jgi:hypothetical protein|nr:hypothetical protein [Prevotellaceae bacterium]
MTELRRLQAAVLVPPCLFGRFDRRLSRIFKDEQPEKIPALIRRNFHMDARKFPSLWKFSCVLTEIFLRPYGNFLASLRKFSYVLTEIFLRPYGNFLASLWKFSCVLTEIFLRPYGNFLASLWKFSCVLTILKEFVSTSKDSTYLVFTFTYLCPHCMNSIENLNRYESSGSVDKVIGIALEDSIAEYRFKEIFKPEFSIRNYPAGTLFRLTNSFPVAYYIKNDSIMAELSGELPCSYVFIQKNGRTDKK